jgi:hypothetical protein
MYSNGGDTDYQSNFAYRYSPWRILWNEIVWKPVQVGIFALYSWDQSNYFLKSPNKYPSGDYYEQTAFRWGIEFGSQIGFWLDRWAIGYSVRITDAGVIALYNNTERDLQYSSSSGVRVECSF